jgi:mRNA interferase MazF
VPVICYSPTWPLSSVTNRAATVPCSCCPVPSITSNELRNKQIIVAAITSRQRGFPFHIPVGADAGLRVPSWIQAETVRAISAERVTGRLGRAHPETPAEVRRFVVNFLRDW